MTDSSTAQYDKCKHDHDYTPENTQLGSDGKRRCRQCARDRGKNRKPTEARLEYMKSYQAEWMRRRRAD